jgi:hypothetical protein
MAILGTFIQQPNEVLDYDVDYSEWIPAGDVVLTATATADPGITLGDTLIDPTGLVVKQWVSGGVNGETYKIQVSATTDEGRVKEAEFRIRIREY